jgi:transglutaminase-like putative cysteine protease
MSMLVAVVASHAFAGAGPESVFLRSPRTLAPAVDLSAAVEETQRLEQQAQARQREQQGLATVDVGGEVARLQGLAGQPLPAAFQCSWTALLVSLPGLEAEAQRLSSSAESLGRLAERVHQEGGALEAGLVERLQSAPSTQATALQAALEELRGRQRIFAALAQTTQARLARRGGGLAGLAVDLALGCVAADARTSLEGVRRQLEAWGVASSPAITGSSTSALTYVSGGQAPSLPSGGAQAAYDTATRVGPSLEDSTADREIVFSPDVTAKATALADAKGAFDFVRSSIRLEWSYGAMKDTASTLRDGAGSDAETAGLLVALLRSQGTPARYVFGTVHLSLERLAGAMGWLSAQEADLLEGGGAFVLDVPRRRAVLAQLAAGGLPFHESQGVVSFAHVWVEAYLPYAAYRGVPTGTEGKQWVPLEPSLPGRVGYARAAPSKRILDEMGETAASLTQAYLAAPRGQDFGTFLKARVEAFLATHHPGATFDATLDVVTRRPEALDVIPGSLPYDVVSVAGEYAFLPDTLLHRVHVQVTSGTSVALDTTLPTYGLAAHRVLLTSRPATPADEAVVGAFGSLYGTPAPAVNLLPVLRVDGVEKATGVLALGLGATQHLVLEFLLPGGASRRIDNDVITGNVLALGVGAPTNGFVEPSSHAASDVDGPAERWLYARAAGYSQAWTDSEATFADVLGTHLGHQAPSLVLVEHQLAIEESLGVRTRVRWKGVQVDADFRSTTPVSANGSEATFMQLSGLQGSGLEASILRDATGEESLSTTGLLQEAAAQGIQVLTLDSQNFAGQVGNVSAPANVLRDVSDAVTAGKQVQVPVAPLAVRDWQGTGFLVTDALTSESGYFLSGVVSGGVTVVSPQNWTDQALAKQLGNAGNPDATSDATKIARIIRAQGLETQQTTVGVRPLSVSVYVTTDTGVRVSGAPVSFTAQGSSTATFIDPQDVSRTCPGPLAKASAITDGSGLATVKVCPDVIIAHRATLMTPPAPALGVTPVKQLFGLTEVTATVQAPTQAIGLAQPFTLVAGPGASADAKLSVTRLSAAPDETPGLSLNGGLTASVTDAFGNAIANAPVQWASQLSSGQFFASVDSGPRRWDNLIPDQLPALTQYTDTLGTANVGYITSSTAGTDTVIASSLGKTSTLSIPVVRRSDYQLLLAGSVPTEVGAQGIDLSTPLRVQLRHWDGVAWQTVGAADPGVVSMAAHVEARDSKGTLVRSQTPLFIGDTATFWLTPSIHDGTETVTISGNLVTAGTGGATTSKVCCTESLALAIPVTPIVVTPRHRVLGGPEEVLANGGFAALTDVGIGFGVTRNNGSALTLKLEQSPLPIVSVKDPNSQAVGQIVFPPGLGGSYLGGVVGGTPGTLTATLTAPRPSTGGATAVLFDDPSGVRTSSLALRVVAPRGDVVPTVVPGEVQGLPDTLVAAVDFSVRTPHSQKALPSTTAAVDYTKAHRDEPILHNATLALAFTGSGEVRVFRGTELVGQASVVVGGQQLISFGNIPGETRALDRLFSRQADPVHLFASFAPGVGVEDVTVTFLATGETTETTHHVAMETLIHDYGVMPIAHTFVKGVDVADGHLVRQFADFSVQGRGVPLDFHRTYSSLGTLAGRSPLGAGWEHSFRISLSRAMASDTNGAKYIVSGGDGSGQVFTCDASDSHCLPQSGFHTSLTKCAAASSAPCKSPSGWVLTTRGGTRLEFEPSLAAGHFRAARIFDRAAAGDSQAVANGNFVALEYNSTVAPDEVTRVVEAYGRRALEFTYSRPSTPAGSLVFLDSVNLILTASKTRSCPKSCGKVKWRILPVGNNHRPLRRRPTGGTRHGRAYQ